LGTYPRRTPPVKEKPGSPGKERLSGPLAEPGRGGDPVAVHGNATRLTLAIGAAVSALLLWRIASSGVQPYGADGAQYIEQFERLRVLAVARSRGIGHPLRLMFDADGSFPPLLHLLTVGAGALIGHGTSAAAACSIGWLLLLAGAAAACARTLGGRGDAAFLATLLLPGLHGAAVRYYYDLPMTALLWAAVAAIVLGRGRIGAAAGAGLALAAASLVKWAALPLGVPLLLGAIGGSARSKRDRAVEAALVAVVAGALCGLFLLGSGSENSFGTHARATWSEGPPRGGGGGLVALVLGRFGERLTDAGWRGLVFYPVRLVTSVLSPLGAVALGALLVAGRRGLRPLLLPGALAVSATAIVLLFVVPVWDERFLLPLAPGVAVAAGLAFERVRGAAWGPALVAVGVAVALDFHVGPAGPHNAEVLVLDGAGEHLPRTHARGIFAAGSEERRGWSRRDEDRPLRRSFREALWSSIERCGAGRPAVLAERPLIDEEGDHTWLQVRALEAELLDGRARVEPEAICIPDPPPGDAERAARTDLLITSRAEGLALPPCASPPAWEVVGAVDDPDGGAGALLWRRPGRGACPGG
jgi:hypothetical protein